MLSIKLVSFVKTYSATGKSWYRGGVIANANSFDKLILITNALTYFLFP